MAQIVSQSPQMMIVPAAANPGAKDSRWLTLEVCREFQRAKCSRTENECKFAHPPPHVEVQNGRVVACFDSIKGKCQRKDPPCKYLHPPQHLREQLLQNGRNNLILKNLQIQAYHQQAQLLPVAGNKTAYAVPTMIQGQYPYLAHPGSSQAPPTAVLRPPTMQQTATASSPYDATHYPNLTTLSAMQAPTAAPAGYNPYITTSLAPSGLPGSPEPPGIMSQPLAHTMLPTKAVRADKFETVSQNGEGVVTSHASLVDSLGYPTYITQASAGAAAAPTLPHGMVLAKKRPRDPQDDILLPQYFTMSGQQLWTGDQQSTMPGVMPAYKRIAVGDISKGGYPVYQTNPLMTQLPHASLMQLQQPPSYVPMSFAGQPPSVPRF